MRQSDRHLAWLRLRNADFSWKDNYRPVLATLRISAMRGRTVRYQQSTHYPKISQKMGHSDKPEDLNTTWFRVAAILSDFRQSVGKSGRFCAVPRDGVWNVDTGVGACSGNAARGAVRVLIDASGQVCHARTRNAVQDTSKGGEPGHLK